MSRREFTRKVRAQAFERANGCCEKCHMKLKIGEVEYDHVLPAELGGDNDLSNCECLCKVCHKAKTANDIRRIRKADRQRDKLSGAKMPKGRPLPGTKASGWKRKMSGEWVKR